MFVIFNIFYFQIHVQDLMINLGDVISCYIIIRKLTFLLNHSNHYFEDCTV